MLWGHLDYSKILLETTLDSVIDLLSEKPISNLEVLGLSTTLVRVVFFLIVVVLMAVLLSPKFLKLGLTGV